MHSSLHRRTVIYTRTSEELEQHLRQKIEARGDIVVGVFADHKEGSRWSRTGWQALLASLDRVDQIAVGSAGDLPSRTVGDLLRLLGSLRDHDVGLVLLAEGIDTSHGSTFAVLDIIHVFKRAKVSQAIRRGQSEARTAGKRIGRPEVPAIVRRRITAALAVGGGIRPTAKTFGVSPATVINIRRSMAHISFEAT